MSTSHRVKFEDTMKTWMKKMDLRFIKESRLRKILIDVLLGFSSSFSNDPGTIIRS